MTNIREFIGEDIISLIEPDSIWLTTPKPDFSECTEYVFDGSLFDYTERAPNKYKKEVAGFDEFSKMTLEQLSEIVKPPSDGKRTIILGTTEYLSPYIAYCMKFIEKHEIDIESGKRPLLPFIFIALDYWNEERNINVIDCISYYYRHNKYRINILISKDRTKWLTKDGKPRITILEMLRLNNNIIGEVPIEITDDDYFPNTYKIIIENKVGGKRMKRRSIGTKSSKKRVKTRRNKRNKRNYTYRSSFVY